MWCGHLPPFWATVCRLVRPIAMLSDRCLSCLSCRSFLSVCDVGVLWQTVGWIKVKLGIEAGLAPGHIVLDGDPALIFGPCLLWPTPNGWIDQDATWYGGRPQPWRQCVRWEPSSSSKKSTAAPTFRPMPIVVKRLDGSRCHKGRPWPRPHCVRWGPISPKVAQPPQFFTHVYCGQTVAQLSYC